MTIQKAKRIGIITTTIIALIQVLIYTGCYSYFIVNYNEFIDINTLSHFRIIDFWDIAIPVTIIVSIFKSRTIGEEVIIQKENSPVNRDNLLTFIILVSCFISCVLVVVIATFETGAIEDTLGLLFIPLIIAAFLTVYINSLIIKIATSALYRILKSYQ